MAGSRLPVVSAHGEGRVAFANEADLGAATGQKLGVVRYVDNHGAATERYPWNPNGSAGGLAGFTSRDGRATIMMPHPERGFRALQLSYRPSGCFKGEVGPWARLFHNARAFCRA